MAVCQTLEEIWYNYNGSGLLTMVLQEFIEWDSYFRCLCLGQRDVLVMRYDPRQRRYLSDTDHLDTPLGRAPGR